MLGVSGSVDRADADPVSSVMRHLHSFEKAKPFHAARGPQRGRGIEGYELLKAGGLNPVRGPSAANPALRTWYRERWRAARRLDTGRRAAPGYPCVHRQTHRTEREVLMVNVRYMVNDVEAAVAFYTTHLGFTVLSSTLPPARRNAR